MNENKGGLVWIGDAAVASGFAKCTHYILDYLKNFWDVTVLGLNYLGDPHNYSYPIYPCFSGGDSFGVNRVANLVSRIKPSLIIIQNDPWNIPAYLKVAGNVPVIASMPVDGKNCRGRDLNGLALAIFWTKFGRDEANKGGYTGSSEIIPLGIDRSIFYPKGKIHSRKAVGLPERLNESFIVGNVNRNQPRKRLDLTIEYFTEWIRSCNINDAYLFFHVAPTGDSGYDINQLGHYYGIANRLILAEPDIGRGVKEESLADIYNCFDIQITTTQGEGWGLTTMEGIACGIPQVVPDWSALGEWAKGVAIIVPCYEHICTPNNINVIGGIPDRELFIESLNLLYKSDVKYEEVRQRGLNFIQKDEYSWDKIADRFNRAISNVLYPEVLAKNGS